MQRYISVHLLTFKMFLSILLPLFLLCVTPTAAETKCICYQELNSTLSAVTEMEAPPDGSGRLFLGEKSGVVHILDTTTDSFLTPPFMDLSANVSDTSNERGFLAMTFHPGYVNNSRFYVYYSTNIPGQITRLSEFQTSADPNLADMTSERILMEISQPFSNHNGGDLLFGLDGMMYIFLGDGGSSGDPNNNGQNKATKLGSALRIDVDSRTGDLEYGIPPDNPFVVTEPNNPELYAYGLRNPWRVTMDTGNSSTQAGRGRIFVADVGQNKWEEVDLLQSGGNYGWAAREGPECFKNLLNCPLRPVCVTDATEVCPLVSYNHTVGQCIIGGHVYRGCVNLDYNGWYFFSDYMRPAMYRMIESSTDEWEWDTVPACAECSDFEGIPYTFGMDGNGEIYLSTITGGDHIYRLYDPDFNMTTPCPLP